MNFQASDFFGLRKSDREFSGLYVTGERQKWRDHIRGQADVIQLIIESIVMGTESNEKVVASLRSVRTSIAVRLNPGDADDNDLLNHLDELIDKCKINVAEEVLKASNLVIEEISWMLKHDWNRVKYEALPIWYFWKSNGKVDRRNKIITKPSTAYDAIRAFIVFFIVLVIILTSVVFLHSVWLWLLCNF